MEVPVQADPLELRRENLRKLKDLSKDTSVRDAILNSMTPREREIYRNMKHNSFSKKSRADIGDEINSLIQKGLSGSLDISLEIIDGKISIKTF